MPFSLSLKFNTGSSYSSLPTEEEPETSNSLDEPEGFLSESTVTGTSPDLEKPSKEPFDWTKPPLLKTNTSGSLSRLKLPHRKSLPAPQDDTTGEVLYLKRDKLNVGQVNRFKITYTPPEDKPNSGSPEKSLWLRVKNLEVVALRAAYLAGPFILYVDVRPEDYDQDEKIYSTADQPMYEPQLKAGQSFYAELFMNKNKKQYTWVVDVVSQIIFSNTAQIQFEVSVGTTKESLHHVTGDHNVGILKHKSMLVNRFTTDDLWNSPVPKFDKPLHLVVITHGLHSNTGADMLYVKEAIDKAAKASGENVVVRGYFDNVRKTERGVKYLGKRLAKCIVEELAPENPVNLPSVKKISFIGHSLGGLVQTYAMAFIDTHYPDFFQRVEPVNFICLASPLLGISNENPAFIKFALDIGFVGKSGQDLGLTKKPTMPGKHSKPLLQILPTGPSHKILVRFKHRTLYANAVNDGIVPLRTSALLYLDWQGLYKVEKAIRGEDTGKPPTYVTDEGPSHRHSHADDSEARHSNSDFIEDNNEDEEEGDDHDAVVGKIPEGETSLLTPRDMNNGPTNPRDTKGIFESMLSYFTPQATPSNPPKIYTRGQTRAAAPDDVDDDLSGGVSSLSIKPDDSSRESISTSSTLSARRQPEPEHFKTTANKKYHTKNGDILVPKKTSVFESGVSVLLPPLPSQSFILDPDARPATIFHDRIYHDYDLPQPRLRKQSSLFKKSGEMVDKSKMEEKIARDWHREMSWRKVLVRLEPDAHNNIIVRRRFANAYGWPVIDHLVKNHFSGGGTPIVSSSGSSVAEPSLGISTSLTSGVNKHLTYTPIDVIRGTRQSFEAQGLEEKPNKSTDVSNAEEKKSLNNDFSQGTKKGSEEEPPLSTKPPLELLETTPNGLFEDPPSEPSPASTHQSSRSVDSSINNTRDWAIHLAEDRDDSEDEGLLFTMGNMFDNLREIGNLNFNGISLGGGDAKYSQVSTSDDTHYPGALGDAEDHMVGFIDRARVSPNNFTSQQLHKPANPISEGLRALDDEYSVYGPLNGDSIEERLAKQGF